MSAPRIFISALVLTFGIAPVLPVLAADSLPPPVPLDLEQQVLNQGPLLLGNLRQARDAGLRRDPWGMAESLQEAQRVLDAMKVAEHLIQADRASDTGTGAASGSPEESVPLGQPLELDRPVSGGREQAIGRLDDRAGSIPLEAIDNEIARARKALDEKPPALGAALLATDSALGQVHWDKGLQPEAWAAARDQVLNAYVLALDSRRDLPERIAAAEEALAALPSGKPFAERLAGLASAPKPDLDGLAALVRDLDAKVRSLRDAAQLAH